MSGEDFLRLLRCPLSHESLAHADGPLVERLRSAVADRVLKNRAGDVIDEGLDGGLVNESRTLVYPVREGIPCLLVDEAIPLDQLAAEPREEAR